MSGWPNYKMTQALHCMNATVRDFSTKPAEAASRRGRRADQERLEAGRSVCVLRSIKRTGGHPCRSIRHGAIFALAGPDIGVHSLSTRSPAARSAGTGSPKPRGTPPGGHKDALLVAR